MTGHYNFVLFVICRCISHWLHNYIYYDIWAK